MQQLLKFDFKNSFHFVMKNNNTNISVIVVVHTVLYILCCEDVVAHYHCVAREKASCFCFLYVMSYTGVVLRNVSISRTECKECSLDIV